MTTTDLYGAKFYDNQSPNSAISARQVVPVILELLHPRSVIDVGCGVGTWCAAFSELGVADVCGLDGPWVDRKRFALGSERFVAFDFASAPKPYKPALPRPRFDLLVSFEFLEHVNAVHASDLVAFMAETADVVLASAAPPGQGGEHHVNEQWPSYWSELFAARGFVPFDALRPLIWNLPGVEPWYLQNPICYFKGAVPASVQARVEYAALQQLRTPASMVHPELFRRKASALSRRKDGLLKRIFRRR